MSDDESAPLHVESTYPSIEVRIINHDKLKNILSFESKQKIKVTLKKTKHNNTQNKSSIKTGKFINWIWVFCTMGKATTDWKLYFILCSIFVWFLLISKNCAALHNSRVVFFCLICLIRRQLSWSLEINFSIVSLEFDFLNLKTGNIEKYFWDYDTRDGETHINKLWKSVTISFY